MSLPSAASQSQRSGLLMKAQERVKVSGPDLAQGLEQVRQDSAQEPATAQAQGSEWGLGWA